MTTPPQSGHEPDTQVPAQALITQFEAPEPLVEETTEAPAIKGGRRRTGQIRDIWKRFRRNKLAVVGLAVVGFLMVIAILQPFISPYDPMEQNLLNTRKPPSGNHFFGTDILGRDMFSGILYGVKLAMIVGWSVMVLSLIVGVALGAIAGFRGKAVDSIIMRVTDIVLAFPSLIGAILVVQIFGNGIWQVIIALVLLSWPTAARLMRGSTLSLRESEYVEAARSIGASDTRIVTRHVLPNAIAPTLIYSFSHIGVAIVAMASLAFLGIGVPADIPEWGTMIADAVPSLNVEGESHMWIFPSLAIVVTTLAFAFVADGLRDSIDPKLR
ncbi:ABC transporter permease [Actinophytocola xanthii]|uniref:ABC transporter permease n=1 Tax=Actinophytocola xanthii TaxID=1912961 RepID=UPI0009FA219C|nr:ABC transporter permease [Actinophytocola xanthii]